MIITSEQRDAAIRSTADAISRTDCRRDAPDGLHSADDCPQAHAAVDAVLAALGLTVTSDGGDA